MEAVQTPLISAEGFWQLCQTPEYEDAHIELIEGEIVEMSPAGIVHGALAMRTGRLFADFADDHDLGYVFAAETGFILHRRASGRDTVLAPDVAFVAKARIKGELPRAFFPGAPDIAVEVISPSETLVKVARKVALYLRYGTEQVWALNSDERTITVHQRGDDGAQVARVYTEDDTIEVGALMPGFRLPVRDVFSVMPSAETDSPFEID